MERVIDFKSEKSIYTQLGEKLDTQYELDKKSVMEEYEVDELEEELGYLESDYDLYKSKLEYVLRVKDLDKENQERYFSVLEEIDSLEVYSLKRRLKMMLSYSVLVNYFKKIHERSNHELFILSSCSIGMDLEDYTYYIGILSDSNVCKAITDKTDDLKNQVDVAYEILDSQDALPYDFITRDNYDILVNNAIKVTKEYEIPKQK